MSLTEVVKQTRNILAISSQGIRFKESFSALADVGGVSKQSRDCEHLQSCAQSKLVTE